MSGRWVFPLDPECPEVEHAFQIQVPHDCVIDGEQIPAGTWIDDPMASFCWDDLWEGFETRHRMNCGRCQEYGAANVDVEYC